MGLNWTKKAKKRKFSIASVPKSVQTISGPASVQLKKTHLSFIVLVQLQNDQIWQQALK